MTPATIRIWSFLHKWTSLICTLFLFLLCLTGLPLIFHEEIDALSVHSELAPLPANTALRSIDDSLHAVLDTRPGEVGLFVSFDEDRPVVNVTTGRRPDVAAEEMHFQSVDQRTAALIPTPTNDGVMQFLLRLHTDLFMGQPVLYFMGLMGLLFVVSIVSGVVVYAPFMHRLDFGTVRRKRSSRLKWLDYHNLLGIVTVAWCSVVGLTGIINTLQDPIIAHWRNNQVAELTTRYAGMTAPRHFASIQAAVDTARHAAPGMRPQFVAFPGTTFSSAHHYAVFMQGATPATRKLLEPALIDAETGELTALRPMPWYVQAFLLSQPLHFGDYGAMPLKILWAVLDIVTLVVLGSGLYLWIGRR